MPKTRSAPMNERIVRLWIQGFNAAEIADVSGSTVSDVEHAIEQYKKHELTQPRGKQSAKTKPSLIGRITRCLKQIAH